MSELKTPLYDVHVEEGGKIVPFAGYLLPVQYGTGVIAEHQAVRTAAGLFDVSHMGEFTVSGPTALETLNKMLTNDFTNMTIGRVRYSVCCYEDGGCVDDLIVYKFGEESYLLVVNAANRHKDFEHMSKYILDGTKFEDISDSVAQIALQGPKAPGIIAKLLPEEQIPQKYYTAVKSAQIEGIECMLSRTGYTGELGYEIYCAAADGAKLWKVLRAAGEEFGCIPCGLGARDTLRLEAAMPLYGHEMDETVSPLETDLDFGVKMNKEDFVGKAALVAAGTPKRMRIGLEATGRGILREHMPVFKGDVQVGQTTSGTKCPYINKAVAMALVENGSLAEGDEVEVEVRGRRVAAKVIPLPFYKRS